MTCRRQHTMRLISHYRMCGWRREVVDRFAVRFDYTFTFLSLPLVGLDWRRLLLHLILREDVVLWCSAFIFPFFQCCLFRCSSGTFHSFGIYLQGLCYLFFFSFFFLSCLLLPLTVKFYCCSATCILLAIFTHSYLNPAYISRIHTFPYPFKPLVTYYVRCFWNYSVGTCSVVPSLFHCTFILPLSGSAFITICSAYALRCRSLPFI